MNAYPRDSIRRLLRGLALDQSRRRVFPHPLECRLPPSTVPCPLGELNLTDVLRLGLLRILGAGQRHCDEGRALAADALKRRHDRAAELDAPPGSDAARIGQAPALEVTKQ